MPFLQWSELYSLNFPIIDQQHQSLFFLVNNLHHNLTQGKGSVDLDKALDALVEYARVHFIEEEVLMAKTHYPDLAIHQDQHDFFVTRVFELQNDYRRGRYDLAMPVMEFLSEWLSNHIMVSDKAIGTYVSNHASPSAEASSSQDAQGNTQ